ncbi:MAG: hypothetical protein WD472_07970 [Dehalococcoidia bacterium]
MAKIKLREIAFCRSGDKGDTCNLGLVPYDESNYELMKDQVTVERVRERFGDLVKGEIQRYELPGIKCLNFVLNSSLGGGVSRSLSLDLHGKAYASLLHGLEVEN